MILEPTAGQSIDSIVKEAMNNALSGSTVEFKFNSVHFTVKPLEWELIILSDTITYHGMQIPNKTILPGYGNELSIKEYRSAISLGKVAVLDRRTNSITYYDKGTIIRVEEL